jgi:tRNA(Ile)-lysidine synthase
MPALLHRVRRFVREHGLLRPDTRVIAAVSGGPDSVALAHLLADLAAAGEVQFVALVHLNHQLRETAARDERFCAALAERLGRPLFADRADVRSRADREGRSLEDAAHEARYELFAQARTRLDAEFVAVGHTQDDQAETFLMRLIRGAGPQGLAGMYPRHNGVVRPLLTCNRAALRQYLADRGESFVEDETNCDVTVLRNRVRAILMPLVASHFNPNIVEGLAREAELMRDVWGWLEFELDRFGSPLEIDRLQRAPVALRRLALWRAMREAAGARTVTFDHVNAALDLLTATDGASVDAPGHRVQRNEGRLVLTSTAAVRQDGGPAGGKAVNLFAYPLSIPGEVADAHGRFVVSVEAAESGPVGAAGANVGIGETAMIRRDLVGSTLMVRNRRPGDRFRPVGLGGHKKLQDFFVDRKIARSNRDAVPIVVDHHDRIVWVGGYGIDEAFRVTDSSQAVLLLKLRYLEAFS